MEKDKIKSYTRDVADSNENLRVREKGELEKKKKGKISI